MSNNYKSCQQKSKSKKSPISEVRRNSGDPKFRKNNNLNTDLCDAYKEPIKSCTNQFTIQSNHNLFN